MARGPSRMGLGMLVSQELIFAPVRRAANLEAITSGHPAGRRQDRQAALALQPHAVQGLDHAGDLEPVPKPSRE